ncbi:MAG: Hpt domain-containing protein [Bacteroidota bacterium]
MTPNLAHDGKNTSSLSASDVTRKAMDDFIEKLSKRGKGSTSFMIEMAKIFLSQAPQVLSILAKASTEENHEAIRFEAHKFKSTVNIVGLEKLRVLAAKTEEVYHHGKPEVDTTQLLEDFSSQIKTDVKIVEAAIESITNATEH